MCSAFLASVVSLTPWPCAAQMEGNAGRRCFQLFGADFVLDEDLKVCMCDGGPFHCRPVLHLPSHPQPWLLGFCDIPLAHNIPTPSHRKLVSSMLADVVKLVVDPLFQPTRAMQALWADLPSRTAQSTPDARPDAAAAKAAVPRAAAAAASAAAAAAAPSDFHMLCTVPSDRSGAGPGSADDPSFLVAGTATDVSPAEGLAWWKDDMGLAPGQAYAPPVVAAPAPTPGGTRRARSRSPKRSATAAAAARSAAGAGASATRASTLGPASASPAPASQRGASAAGIWNRRSQKPARAAASPVAAAATTATDVPYTPRQPAAASGPAYLRPTKSSATRAAGTSPVRQRPPASSSGKREFFQR